MKKKHILSCLSLLMLSTFAISQTWEENRKIAEDLFWKRNYDSAKHYITLAIDESKRFLQSNDTTIASMLHRLAMIYFSKFQYTEAESVFSECIPMLERNPGPNNRYLLKALNNFALTYQYHQKNDLAKSTYLKAIFLQTEKEPMVMPYLNLSGIYANEGEYSDAVQLLNKANDLGIKGLLPKEQQWFTMIQLVYLKSMQGKTNETILLGEQALSIAKELGDSGYYVADIISNLAPTYMSIGEFGNAEKLLKEEVSILERSPTLARDRKLLPLDNLSVAYLHMKRYDEAEKLIRQVLYERDTLGQHGTGDANSLVILAKVLLAKGMYVEAESLFNLSLSIWKQQPQNYLSAMTEIPQATANYYRTAGNPKKALDIAYIAYFKWKSVFPQLTKEFSERDANDYSRLHRNALDLYFSCFYDKLKLGKTVLEKDAEVFFTTKGGVSDAVFHRNAILHGEHNNEIAKLAESYEAIREQLSNYYIQEKKNDERFHAVLDSLSKLSDDIEFKLARQNQNFKQRLDYQNITVNRLADVLPSQTVLVEYLKYNYQSLKSDTVIQRYFVAVLDKSNKIIVEDLGTASAIDELLKSYQNNFFVISSPKNSLSMNQQHEYDSIAKKLYRTVFQPIRKYINDSSTLFIAPDGALNLVSFAGLIDEDGKYLIENHPIHYLSAGRDLLRLNKKEKSNQGLLAFGDPDYDAPAIARLSHEQQEYVSGHVPSDPYAYRNVRSECDILSNLDVAPLPATRREVSAVKEHWGRKYKREIPTVYYGADASEEHFKQNAAGHRVIHLATHGYFLDPDCRNGTTHQSPINQSLILKENPLLQSGLLLAGANLKGADADSLGAEDGILTALEVSAMNLRGTDLVVLSACETGLGEIKAGEGVYGLRRAFQLAGAKTVVSSLWQIPDNETVKFMKDLYAQTATTYPELMQKVMLQRLKELRAKNRSTHPYSWAGFVATGEWRIK